MAHVLITSQPGAIGAAPTNAYGPDNNEARLIEAGHLLADGATPPMTFEVVELQPARWDSV